MTSRADTRRAVGLSSLPERVLLLLGPRKLELAVAALSPFVAAKAALAEDPPNQDPLAGRRRPHTFAVWVLHPHTLEPHVVSEFNSDAAAVLAALASVLAETGRLTAAAGAADGAAALDLSRLLMRLKPLLDPDPHLSSLLHVVCAYGGNIGPSYSSSASSSASAFASCPAAPFFSAGGADAHADVLGHPGFVFDLLYLHDAEDTSISDEQHQTVFNAFGGLKVRGDGFFYHKCPSFFFARRTQDEGSVHMAVAVMLQHPALRLEQPEDFGEMERLLCLQ